MLTGVVQVKLYDLKKKKNWISKYLKKLIPQKQKTCKKVVTALVNKPSYSLIFTDESFFNDYFDIHQGKIIVYYSSRFKIMIY